MSSFRDRMDAAKASVDRRTHKHIAIDALKLHGFDDIAARLKNCGPRQYCQSAWCFKCRDRLIDCQTRKVLSVHRKLHGADELKARKSIYFVTILNELCLLDHGEVEAALERGRKALASLRRSFDGLLTYGRFELEAMDMQVIFHDRPCKKKAVVLKGLNGGSEDTTARVMGLFHLHSLVFLNGHDADSVRRKLAAMFPGSYRVQMRPLYDDMSVEQSIRNLCRYMLKSKSSFNYTMKTNGDSVGRSFDTKTLTDLVVLGMNNEVGVNCCNVYSKCSVG